MKITHIGYYNEKDDLDYLFDRSPDEILEYYKNGYGNFFKVKDSAINYNENRQEKLFTSDKQYLVCCDYSNNKSDSFIDIYKVVSND